MFLGPEFMKSHRQPPCFVGKSVTAQQNHAKRRRPQIPALNLGLGDKAAISAALGVKWPIWRRARRFDSPKWVKQAAHLRQNNPDTKVLACVSGFFSEDFACPDGLNSKACDD